LRSPVIAARVVCASHPVAWVRSTMVAPSVYFLGFHSPAIRCASAI
jgi:hypothetical protein